MKAYTVYPTRQLHRIIRTKIEYPLRIIISIRLTLKALASRGRYVNYSRCEFLFLFYFFAAGSPYFVLSVSISPLCFRLIASDICSNRPFRNEARRTQGRLNLISKTLELTFTVRHAEVTKHDVFCTREKTASNPSRCFSSFWAVDWTLDKLIVHGLDYF